MSNFNRFWRLLLAGSAVLLLFSCTKDELGSRQGSTTEPTESGFVTEKQALDIAATFMESENLAPGLRASSRPDLSVIYTDAQGSDMKSSVSTGKKPTYYVIDVNKTGYVIVSASDATYPVLGYSTESTFNPKDIPANMQDILMDYSKEIKYAWKHVKSNEKIVAMRNASLRGRYTNPQDTITVAPLLGKIHWSQNPYYNAYCPKGCPVGCVATATAQIMRYWEYPKSSTGTYSYVHPVYGKQSFNYNYQIDWKAMPKSRLQQPDSLVAKLCYGVAVSLNMNFNPGGSGAYQFKVPSILQKYYKYPKTVKSLYRDYYTTKEWEKLVRAELDAKRPIQYAGHGSGGGHSFICDGYSKNNYFHINWGWGGTSDGYFKLNALNPDILGTGGGDGGFNSGQQMVVGFAPPKVEPDSTSNYCTSEAEHSEYIFIKEVFMGNMKNTTAGSAEGYGDYISKEVVSKAGASLPFALTPGSYDNQLYECFWGVWIDLNNDGIFEDSEMVVDKYSPEKFNGNIPLPSDLKKGSYRIRVSMKYQSKPTPCESFRYGEVEDYTLVIK